jgi:leader peptidase (prepilin peptidase) / N-methyltransferase
MVGSSRVRLWYSALETRRSARAFPARRGNTRGAESRVTEYGALFASWVWPVIAAPFIGSFLGVVVTRARAPRRILVGRSACEHCGATLAPRDLVPVVSWLATRGRCRHCQAPLGLFYPAIELGALAVALWSAALTSGSLLWASCVLGWWLLTLAAIDIRYFLLPDFLTLPLIIAGLAIAFLLEPERLPPHAIGAAAGFLFVFIIRQGYWLLRRREGIGLGDAKFLAASGAFVSWEGLPSVVLIAAVAALAGALLRSQRGGSISLTDRVPFGAALCLGTWVVWLYGPVGIG